MNYADFSTIDGWRLFPIYSVITSYGEPRYSELLYGISTSLNRLKNIRIRAMLYENREADHDR
jgi:hypothetical protein